PAPGVLKKPLCQASLHKWFPSAKTMLKETIYSSLFILASKRNRVRVGYEKDWFCARLLFRWISSEHVVLLLLAPNLVALISPHIPPTRCILEPPVVGTEKPLFLLRALPQKKSDFAVLASDEFNLELVEWCPPDTRAPSRF